MDARLGRIARWSGNPGSYIAAVPLLPHAALRYRALLKERDEIVRFKQSMPPTFPAKDLSPWKLEANGNASRLIPRLVSPVCGLGRCGDLLIEHPGPRAHRDAPWCVSCLSYPARGTIAASIRLIRATCVMMGDYRVTSMADRPPQSSQGFLPRLRRSVERLGPYQSLVLLLIPTGVVEPLKLVAVALAGEGHWVTGTVMIVIAYAASILLVERLFKIVKPKLLTLPWFAWLWARFIVFRGWAMGLFRWA